MKCNLSDVAKKAGVSIVTASRVINNVKTVRESSRMKVLKAMEELDYTPNVAARALASGKTRIIGLILPELNDPFLMEVVRAVEKEVSKRDYFLAISLSHDSKGNKTNSDYLFQKDRVDGILMLTPLFENEQVEYLTKKKLPFVIMDNQIYPFVHPSIVVDNFQGGYEAGRYLYLAGCEKIAHIGGPENNLAANERYKGFKKALEEVAVTPYLVGRGDFEVSTGYHIVEQWLKEGKLPDAVFAADDHIALGVVDALRLNGLEVPKDISIIGFDDHPFTSQLHPYLTTFKQPAQEIGVKGVELLFEVMEGKHKMNVIQKLKPTLVERDSVKHKR